MDPSTVLIDPVALKFSVKFNRPLVPIVSTLPDATDSVPVTVIVFPLEAASRSQVPLMIRARRLIVGTAVMFADWFAAMMTESPAAGAPLGFQFPAVVHEPPAVGVHVFVAALASAAKQNSSNNAIVARRTMVEQYVVFMNSSPDCLPYEVSLKGVVLHDLCSVSQFVFPGGAMICNSDEGIPIRAGDKSAAGWLAEFCTLMGNQTPRQTCNALIYYVFQRSGWL